MDHDSENAAAAPTGLRFRDLGLSAAMQASIERIGYETPSPIQAQTIPPLLEGRDVLGQAATGTGKTAAFALPILSRLDLNERAPQALVLAPTRELAIQVAEAFQNYAAQLPGFHVLPIYGGQSYEPQLKGLKRGAHVIVGTPGRVVDHLKRGSLDLSHLRFMVLDEADEMLRMGFIEDVEWVLQQCPPTRQTALFSATMPSAIRRVANTYLREPAEITIRARTTTGANIRQRYWLVSGLHKLDALTRFLEVEPFDGMIVFARTKAATVELAEKLEARGFSAAALNGDLDQKLRERTIQRLKDGQVDILVATDVAARGLDVERVSHVVNYDIPTDTESYVHRIGRTGRAGRSGEAILFVAPRERYLLKAIERATRQPIEAISAPSADAIQARRIERFTKELTDTLARAQGDAAANAELETARALLSRIEAETGTPLLDLAAALTLQSQGERPLLGAALHAPAPDPHSSSAPVRSHEHAVGRRDRPREPLPVAAPMPALVAKPRPKPAPPRLPFAGAEHLPRTSGEASGLPRAEPIEPPARSAPPRPAPQTHVQAHLPELPAPDSHPRDGKRKSKGKRDAGVDFETFRIEVGHVHGVKPNNIVGAIANEAGLDAQYIGRIDIREDHSFVDLPAGMPKQIFKDLRKVWVSGKQLAISKAGGESGTGPAESRGAPHLKSKRPRY